MGDEVHIDPPSLRRLANDLTSVVDLLAAAQASIEDSSSVQGDAFSPAGEALAYAFFGALEYAGNDAYEQAVQIASIQERLGQTADVWEQADEYSTVREV